MSFADPCNGPSTEGAWDMFYNTILKRYVSHNGLQREVKELRDKGYSYASDFSCAAMPFEAQIGYLGMQQDGLPLRFLLKDFACKTPNINHEAIQQLYNQGRLLRIYTTNFDYALESALDIRSEKTLEVKAEWRESKIGPACCFWKSSGAKSNKPVYVKLHGNALDPDPGITLDAIGSGYAKEIAGYLYDDLLNVKVLFVGFGGKDVDLLEFLYDFLGDPKHKLRGLYWLDREGKNLEKWKAENPNLANLLQQSPAYYLETDLCRLNNHLLKLSGCLLSVDSKRSEAEYANVRAAAESLDAASVFSFLGLQYYWLNKGTEAQRCIDLAILESSRIDRREKKFNSVRTRLMYAEAYGPQMKFHSAAMGTNSEFLDKPSFYTLTNWAWRRLSGSYIAGKCGSTACQLIFCLLVALFVPFYVLYFYLRKLLRRPLSLFSAHPVVYERAIFREISCLMRVVCEMAVNGYLVLFLDGPFCQGKKRLMKFFQYAARYILPPLPHISLLVLKKSEKWARAYGQLRDVAHATREIGRHLYAITISLKCDPNQNLLKAETEYERAIFLYKILGVADGQMNTLRYYGLALLRRQVLEEETSKDILLCEAKNKFHECLRLAEKQIPINHIEACKASLELTRDVLGIPGWKQYLKQAQKHAEKVVAKDDTNKDDTNEFAPKIINWCKKGKRLRGIDPIGKPNVI